MAIAVASNSAIVASNYPTASVTLTKPTGVAEGDLLLIVAGGQGWHSPTGQTRDNYSANSGKASCTGFTEAIYASYDPNNNSSVGGCARINVLYKIATAGDVAATNYTVTHNSSSYGGAAIMYRITGWTTGNPLAYITNTSIATSPRYGLNQDGSATLSWNPAHTRPSQQVLFFAVCTNGDSDFGFYYTNYASTPTETWTEDGDTTFNVTDYDGGALAVAHATSSATTEVTSMSVYKNLDVSDGGETTVMILFAVFTPVNGAGTSALHSISPTFYSNTGLSDGAGTSALKSVTPTVNAASGSATTNTWTARSKNTTTWTPRN